MAPVANNLTGRIWVDYEVANVPHTMMVRYVHPAQPLPDVLETIGQILGYLKPVLHTSWVVTGVRQSLPNSTISLPIDYSNSPLQGFAGENGGTFDGVWAPREFVMVGRSSTTGRRVRFSVYGVVSSTPANYRFGPGESVFTTTTFVAALNAASFAGIYITADGSSARWYPYVNVNYNSYWERQQRNN